MEREKPTNIRLFFGIPIPEEKANEWNDLLLKENPKLKNQVKWTRAGNHHITLCFLGNVVKNKIPELIKLASESIKDIHRFRVILKSVDLFPAHHGKLSAVNVEPSRPLQILHDLLNYCSNSINVNTEERAYLPHITLFRDNRSHPIQFKRIMLVNETLEVKEFKLYQSIPTEKGSLYKPIHHFFLNIKQ